MLLMHSDDFVVRLHPPFVFGCHCKLCCTRFILMVLRRFIFCCQDRIEDMLIISSPPGKPEELDLTPVPSLLFEKYDIRIANHDGGQFLLRNFCQQGVLSQMNITLCRKVRTSNDCGVLSLLVP